MWRVIGQPCPKYLDQKGNYLDEYSYSYKYSSLKPTKAAPTTDSPSISEWAVCSVLYWQSQRLSDHWEESDPDKLPYSKVWGGARSHINRNERPYDNSEFPYHCVFGD